MSITKAALENNRVTAVTLLVILFAGLAAYRDGFARLAANSSISSSSACAVASMDRRRLQRFHF
mgnify:CR=1 FL=1